MTQLAETVTAEDELWTLDALPSTQYVVVEDETIEVRAPFPSQTYSLTGETLPPRIRVRRAVGGTTAASHNSGSTLTPTYGLGSAVGGGAIAVTDGTTTVENVTTLQLPSGTVTDEGAGVAGVAVQTRLIASALLDLATLGTPALALTIAAGALLIKAFALRTDDAVTGTPPNRITLYIGPASNLNSRNDLITYDLDNAYAGVVYSGGGNYIRLEDGGDTFAGDPALLVDSYARGAVSDVDMALQIGKSALTSGHVIVYALVAVPIA